MMLDEGTLTNFFIDSSHQISAGNFLGGAMDKKPPANAGDRGFIPGTE